MRIKVGVLVLAALLTGCVALSDGARRAAGFDGIRGAAAFSTHHPGNKEIESEVRKILAEQSQKSGMTEDAFVLKEYNDYLYSLAESKDSMDAFMYNFEGLQAMYSKKMISENVYKEIESGFKKVLQDRYVSGQYGGIRTHREVLANFPDLLVEENLKVLTKRSLAALGSRQNIGLLHDLDFVLLVDTYGSPADVLAVKRYLSDYSVGKGELLTLDETRNFKVDRSKFPKPQVLGEFHISEISKFSPQVRQELTALVKDFKDPDNVKFRNVILLQTSSTAHLCGELNGVNSYGAFVGYKYFVTSAVGAKIQDENVNPYSNEVNSDCTATKYSLEQFAGAKIST